jgi:hypothetical protein
VELNKQLPKLKIVLKVLTTLISSANQKILAILMVKLSN